MNKLKVISVDDEPLSHQVIKSHINELQHVELVASFIDPTSALDWLAKNQADLALLDIEMPEVDGLTLAAKLADQMEVVFVTAFDRYAINSYNLDAVDYLMKPVGLERFSKALQKVRSRLSQKSKQQHSVVLKQGRDSRSFIIQEIEMIEAFGNFVKIRAQGRRELVSSTLKKLLSKSEFHGFVQVNKSHIVPLSNIAILGPHRVELKTGQVLKVGPSFKEELRSRVYAPFGYRGT